MPIRRISSQLVDEILSSYKKLSSLNLSNNGTSHTSCTIRQPTVADAVLDVLVERFVADELLKCGRNVVADELMMCR